MMTTRIPTIIFTDFVKMVEKLLFSFHITTKQPCKTLSARLLKKLVVRARLELATYCLEGSCSILMSYRTATLFYNMAHFDVFSTYGGKLCGVYGVTD